jgi:hypothetical protein
MASGGPVSSTARRINARGDVEERRGRRIADIRGDESRQAQAQIVLGRMQTAPAPWPGSCAAADQRGRHEASRRPGPRHAQEDGDAHPFLDLGDELGAALVGPGDGPLHQPMRCVEQDHAVHVPVEADGATSRTPAGERGPHRHDRVDHRLGSCSALSGWAPPWDLAAARARTARPSVTTAFTAEVPR